MIRAVIPAAGKGTRSGLPFPKTLQPVDGIPILVRIMRALFPIDERPVVIVSPEGRSDIADTLAYYELDAELVEQAEPHGMGHAVLQFARSPSFKITQEVVVVWGDMISIPTALIETVISLFRKDGVDFAFPTCFQEPCYAHVVRDRMGTVTELLERREEGDAIPHFGEADCGLFVFRKKPVFNVLRDRQCELIGRVTGEVGFLAVVRVLAKQGRDVRAYPIASLEDTMTFNSPSDLENYSTRFLLR